MTNAQRQAAYRRRHAEAGGGRINMAVEAAAEFALKRMARHYGVTRRAMLERLIADAERDLITEFASTEAYEHYVRD